MNQKYKNQLIFQVLSVDAEETDKHLSVAHISEGHPE